jgi:hypothetical protein
VYAAVVSLQDLLLPCCCGEGPNLAESGSGGGSSQGLFWGALLQAVLLGQAGKLEWQHGRAAMLGGCAVLLWVAQHGMQPVKIGGHGQTWGWVGAAAGGQSERGVGRRHTVA